MGIHGLPKKWRDTDGERGLLALARRVLFTVASYSDIHNA
jgi:hypothetical protein